MVVLFLDVFFVKDGEKLRLVIKMSTKRPFRLKRSKRKKKMVEALEQHYVEQLEKSVSDLVVFKELDTNLDFLKNIFRDCADLVTRTLDIEGNPKLRAAVIYIDELINKDLIHNFVIRPLMECRVCEKSNESNLKEKIHDSLINAGEIKPISEMKKVVDGILSGDSIVFLDGLDQAFVIGSKGWQTKGIDEPRSEAVVRGSREGLSETIAFSWGMIRRRLKDPNLRIKLFTLGKRTQTAVSLLYIEGLTDSKLVEEVTNRIKGIEIDGVLESGYVEEFIQDQTWTPFPQVQNTERPDSVVGHLLEGKVAILVDGSPHALIAPAVFTQFYYSPEDYYERYLISSFLRFIRLVSLFIALLLPALYISFVSFHPEMIPSKLAIAVAAGRSPVPFPPIIEALGMELSVEILREASVRLPGPIGPTIGIVGALVIGNAAVEAALVSPAMVIMVGLTTISSYANPSYNAAISVRLIRFPLMLLAAVFGLYGVMIGLLIMVLHLVQLRSFDVPYMAPYAPFSWKNLRDSLIRVPWNKMKQRPSIYSVQDKTRKKQEG